MRLLLPAILLLTGCGYAPHIDPPVSSSLGSRPAALVACCGSMEPLIRNGDRLVQEKLPFTDALLGTVGTYRTKEGKHLCHRFVAGSARTGFVAQGDANRRPDPERVTAENYCATVVTIIRLPR